MSNANKTISVLIVDDEQTVLDAIKTKLDISRDFHFSVHISKTVEHIIETISRLKPDVIVLDNWIGDKDEGIKKALPTIMAAFPDQKVIVLTSKRGGDTDQIMEARAWGAHTFIDKAGMWQEDLLIRRIVEASGHTWRSA
jgi:response regulator of citrate/malate metabolism